MAKQKHQQKQKFEYKTVVIKAKPAPTVTFSSSSANVTINTMVQTPPSAAVNISQTLAKYAADGWRFISDLTVDDEIMLIFERPTDDYELYNQELSNFIKS